MALQQTPSSVPETQMSLVLPYAKITPIIRKHIMKRFAFLKNEDIPDAIIHEHAKKYNVTDTHVTKQFLRYIIDDLVAAIQIDHRLRSKVPATAFDENVKAKEYFVSIDSKDRNFEQWPNANEFCIDFGGIHNTRTQALHDGYVSRTYTNVESVELISVVVPKYSDTGNHINNFPYLLLEIDELAGIYDGSNKHVSNAFAKLRFQTDLGYFKEYTLNGGERFVKQFHPRISLDRMTIRFKTPSGELYRFGTVLNPTTVSNTPNSSSDVNDSSDLNHNSSLNSKLEQLLLQDPSTVTTSINTDDCPCDVHIPCENTLVFKITCRERRMDTHLYK